VSNPPREPVPPSPATEAATVPAVDEDRCPACLKPRAICPCARIRPVKTRTRVLLLQHPREPDRDLGSARVAHLCLPRSTLRIGLSWPNLRAALGDGADAGDPRPKEWAVLYLGSFRPRKLRELGEELPRPGEGPSLLLLDRHGLPLPASAKLVPALRGLVVLDGNWQQSKTLWWRNAWLLKLQRAVLLPGVPSLFGRVRREPRRESLSTLEAVARSLVAIERRAEIEEALLAPFAAMLEAHAAALG
jgi:DTW domain-containing protein